MKLKKKTKTRNYLFFSISGDNPDKRYQTDKPCLFPFNYLFKRYDKCATVWSSDGAMADVEVNLQEQLKFKIFPGGCCQLMSIFSSLGV